MRCEKDAADDKDARVWGGHHHESRALVDGIQANDQTQPSNANWFFICKFMGRTLGLDISDSSDYQDSIIKLTDGAVSKKK